MVKIEGIDTFNKGIESWLLAVDRLAVETLRGLSVKLFDAVLQNTPQFSGNAVANWRFSVNAKDTSESDFFKVLFWEKSDVNKVAFSKTTPNAAADAAARAAAAGREMGVTSLDDTIYISNSVNYEEWLATATNADLRSVNHVGHLISHSALDVTEGHLFITTAIAQSLANERIV